MVKKKKLPLSSNQVNRGLAIVTKQLIFHFLSLINKIVLSCPCNVKIYQSIRWIIFASYPPWWQYYHDVATTCWSVFIHRSYSIFQSLTHLIISRIHKTYSSMFQIKHQGSQLLFKWQIELLNSLSNFQAVIVRSYECLIHVLHNLL